MAENSGQAPRKTPGGPKGIDWLKGQTLYMQGMHPAKIAEELGCRRELVYRKATKWKPVREEVHEAATSELVASAIDSNLTVLTRIDRAAAKAVATLESMLAYYAAEWASRPKKFNHMKYRLVIASLNEAGNLQRACRGLNKESGLEPDRDRDMRVIVDIMPASRAEYDALKNVTPEAAPA